MAAGDGVPPRRLAAVSREAWVGDGWSGDGAEAEVGARCLEDEMGTTRRRRESEGITDGRKGGERRSRRSQC